MALAEHSKLLLRAAATQLQLNSLGQQYQAAILRDDTAEAERIRREAHDLLDAALDLFGSAAVALRDAISD